MTDNENQINPYDYSNDFRVKPSPWKWVALFLTLLIAVFVGFSLVGSLVAGQPGSFTDKDVNLFKPNPDRPSKGPIDAPIVIIEYGDFQCPFCGREASVIKDLKERYGDKMRVEWRHFPLYSIHPRAVAAAVASECAHTQGMFWEYHDELFEGQSSLEDKDLLRHATNAGLNAGEFAECYSLKEGLDAVNNDYTKALKIGLRSTPSFLVNGRLVEGALSIDQWMKIISQL